MFKRLNFEREKQVIFEKSLVLFNMREKEEKELGFVIALPSI